jgi:hypothetical protein
MQSFLQYRNIRLAARKQVEQDHEKAQPPPNNILTVPAPTALPLTSADDCFSKFELPNPIRQTTTATTTKTQHSIGTTLGHALKGIHVRDRTTNEGKGGKVFVVGWEGQDDPRNPRNWGLAYRIWSTLVVASIAFIVGIGSSADTSILPQAAEGFGVSGVVESMAIGTQ